MKTTTMLQSGSSILRELLERLKALESRRLTIPPPPTETDSESHRAWRQDVIELGAWISTERAALLAMRDSLTGLGEVRIGPMERAILDHVSNIEGGEQPAFLGDDEELVHATYFFPYHRSLLVNEIIIQWAEAHFSDEDWVTTIAMGHENIERHREHAAQVRASKERNRIKD